MGTTYRVVYFDDPMHRDFKYSVDSLLAVLNQSISTYDLQSDITRFNQSQKGAYPKLPYLHDILRKAKRIFLASEGAFDPTVMPLVSAWGFGPQKSSLPSASDIDSLKQLVGFGKVQIRKRQINKKEPRIQLDLGGIGQGYGADVIFSFLQSKGVRHMLVELGGEGVAAGINRAKDTPWTIGIVDPNSTSEKQFMKAYVPIHNHAFTTSGNFFNYRVIDGRKYGHTIDPISGFPIQHSLLSASVFAPDCATADAWATAFMVMGLEKAIKKINTLKGIEAVFMYSDSNGELQTYVTGGMKNLVIID